MAGDVRLYVLLARESPRAVIFRRGPTKRVLLLSWDTSTDRIEEGQWLKGRIYERRCDLSPDGELLVYFAANWKEPYQSWTAISRPPHLTALALWPKGDGWGGGGHFTGRNELALNHRAGEMELVKGSLPHGFRVAPFGEHPGWGEDDPIGTARLVRDGWIPRSGGAVAREEYGAKVWIELDPPIIWEKPRDGRTLRMIVRGIKERDGPWYLIDHELVAPDGTVHTLGRSDWADWSRDGDLLFAKDGCLHRAKAGELANTRVVADLRELAFTPRESPEEARQWPRT